MPANQTTPGRKTPTWIWVSLALVLIAVIGGTIALSQGKAQPNAAAHPMAMPDGFPQEPGWYKNAIGPVKEAYLAAAYNHDVLQHIPCYCGCGSVHASNSACYFTRDAQGEVTAYDQHAYG